MDTGWVSHETVAAEARKAVSHKSIRDTGIQVADMGLKEGVSAECWRV